MLTERDPRETGPEKAVARALQGRYDSLLVGKKANNVDIRPFFKAARLQAVEGADPGALCRGDFASTSLKVRDHIGGVLWFAFFPNNFSLGPPLGPSQVTRGAQKALTNERQQAGGDWPFRRENSPAPVGHVDSSRQRPEPAVSRRLLHGNSTIARLIRV